MLGLKLNHVSKRGHRWQYITWSNVEHDVWHQWATINKVVSQSSRDMIYCVQYKCRHMKGAYFLFEFTNSFSNSAIIIIITKTVGVMDLKLSQYIQLFSNLHDLSQHFSGFKTKLQTFVYPKWPMEVMIFNGCSLYIPGAPQIWMPCKRQFFLMLAQ